MEPAHFDLLAAALAAVASLLAYLAASVEIPSGYDTDHLRAPAQQRGARLAKLAAVAAAASAAVLIAKPLL